MEPVSPTNQLELVVPKDVLFKLTGISPCIFTRPSAPGIPVVLNTTDRTATLFWEPAADLKENFALLIQYKIIVLEVFQETKEVNGVLNVELKSVRKMEVTVDVADMVPPALGDQIRELNRNDMKLTSIDAEIRLALANGTTFTVGSDETAVYYDVQNKKLEAKDSVLLPFTEYKFQIQAANRQGLGPATLESIVTRTKEGPPPPPGKPTSISKDKTTLILQWDSPQSYGAPNSPGDVNDLSRTALYYYQVQERICLDNITFTCEQEQDSKKCSEWGTAKDCDYILNVKPNNTETSKERKNSLKIEPLPVETVQELDSLVPYTFRSRAFNYFNDEIHTGDWSVWSDDIVLCGTKPEKITSFLATTRRSQNFVVEWDKPDDNGLDITEYVVNYCRCEIISGSCEKTCKQYFERLGSECAMANTNSTNDLEVFTKTKIMDTKNTKNLELNLKPLDPEFYYAMIICGCNKQGCADPSNVLVDQVQKIENTNGKLRLLDIGDPDKDIVTLVTEEKSEISYQIQLDRKIGSTVTVNIQSTSAETPNRNCNVSPTLIVFDQTISTTIPPAQTITVSTNGNKIDEGEGNPVRFYNLFINLEIFLLYLQ